MSLVFLCIHSNNSTNSIYSQMEETLPGIFTTGAEEFLWKILLYKLVDNFVILLEI